MSKFTNSVAYQYIHVSWECTWVETHTPSLTTWLQHRQLLNFVFAELKALRHKIFMDNFVWSPRRFGDLDRRKINSWGSVRPNRKDMPRDFGPKQLKLKRGEVRVRTRGGLTALVWKERRDVYMLIWTHHQQQEIFVTTATTQWNFTSWNGTTGTWFTWTILIVWPAAILWVDLSPVGPRNCFSTFYL